MKLGLHYWNYSDPCRHVRLSRRHWPRRLGSSRTAGVAPFTVMDHYFQMEHRGAAEEPMLEGYTTLGYVAAQTERLRWACWSPA